MQTITFTLFLFFFTGLFFGVWQESFEAGCFLVLLLMSITFAGKALYELAE